MKTRKTVLSFLVAVLVTVGPVWAESIHDAARAGDVEALASMLDGDPGLVGVLDGGGNSPLHLAVLGGHGEAAGMMIDRGADLEAENGRGFTPLLIAIHGRSEDLARMILDRGADVDHAHARFGMTPFIFAVRFSTLGIARLLHDRGGGGDLDETGVFGFTPLFHACAFGDMEKTQYLLELGADPNVGHGVHGAVPLHRAAISGDLGLARLLLDHGARPDPVDSSGVTPLHAAVLNGYADVVSLLLSLGARADGVRDQLGRTLLHMAAAGGHLDVVELLVESNVPVDASDCAGRTPLALASGHGNERVARYLEKRSAGTSLSKRNGGPSKNPRKQMRRGEAAVWYMHNRGLVVRTESRLFVFDSEERGERPDEPQLANGRLSRDEIAREDIIAIYSCYHGDPGDKEHIHQLEDSVSSITFVHNARDPWRGCRNTVYMNPGENRGLNGFRVRSVEMTREMPSLGYLCEGDGLSFFYAAFQPDDMDAFRSAVDSLAAESGPIDFLLFPTAGPGLENEAASYIMERLSPSAWLPHDPNHRFRLYRDAAEWAAASGFTTEVWCALYPGDAFSYRRAR